MEEPPPNAKPLDHLPFPSQALPKATPKRLVSKQQSPLLSNNPQTYPSPTLSAFSSTSSVKRKGQDQKIREQVANALTQRLYTGYTDRKIPNFSLESRDLNNRKGSANRLRPLSCGDKTFEASPPFEILKAKKPHVIPISSTWMKEAKIKQNGISFFNTLTHGNEIASTRKSLSAHAVVPPIQPKVFAFDDIPIIQKKQRFEDYVEEEDDEDDFFEDGDEENDEDGDSFMETIRTPSPLPIPVAPAAERVTVSPVPTITPRTSDTFLFIEYLKKNPTSRDFVYLVSTSNGVKNDLFKNPYKLEIVEFSKIDKSQGYYTISSDGVTYFDKKGHGEFTALDQWLREYDLFHNLINIPFFKRYRTWKLFTLWRRTILRSKIIIAKQHLEKNLFLVHPILRQALLKIRSESVDIMLNKRFINIDPTKSYNLDEFVIQQNSFIDNFSQGVLKEWENSVRQTVEKAGVKCLLEKGFQVKNTSTPKYSRESLNAAISDQKSLKSVKNNVCVEKKLSFTEQAARRTECRRLQRFVKLVDYIIVNVLHILTIESVSDLLRFIYNGCKDDDVIFSTLASSTENEEDASKVVELVEIVEEIEEDVNPNTVIDSQTSPIFGTEGMQLGGIIIGPEVGTKQLAEVNGYDMFPFILSKMAKEHLPKLDLIEIIEKEGPLHEASVVDEEMDNEEIGKPGPQTLKSGKQTNVIPKEPKFIPLFQTELLLDHDKPVKNLRLAPSLNDFISMVDNLLKTYISVVEGIPFLTNTIPYLDPANQSGDSSIRGLQESEYREGPNISTIIVEGAFFREICGRIRGTLLGIFINSSNWVKQWEVARNMWVENQSYNGLEEMRSAVGELTTHLATASQEEQEGGVTQILIDFHKKTLQEQREREARLIADAKAKEVDLLVEDTKMEEPSSKNTTGQTEISPETTQVEDQVQKQVQLIPSASATEEISATGILELAFPIETDSEGVQYSPLVKFFKNALSNFSDQLNQMTVIPESKIIGNILLNTDKFKNILLPSPKRCFEEVAQYLPGLAKDKNEVLLTQVQNWVRLLQLPPQNVDEFVLYLGRFDVVQKSLDLIQEYNKEIIQLYGLIDFYKIAIQPTDLALFQTLGPTLRQLREVVDLAADNKEENIVRFSTELDKATTDLMAVVSEIRNKAQDPMVLNSGAKSEMVIDFLENLSSQLQQVEAKKKKFETWDALFKSNKRDPLEIITRVDASVAVVDAKTAQLEETKVEVKLKLNLWRSIKEWESLTEEWKKLPFDTLNTEIVNSQIQAYTKNLYNLEKGLPPNEVVPKLRSMVEEYKVMYPTIVDLRNNALKQRHWDKIQESIGKPLQRDENFTFEKLLELKIFEFKEEINHISSQASSEATLEEMLAKIGRNWNDAEFIVINYRDSKDVFIMGPVDDIQTLLEDSQVTIATIKSSKFIGPIKSEVERWDKNLSLFAETLEMWMICQKNWLYLESIFSAPDIQRQLPDEARMFSQVDRNWKDIMRKAVRSPNALKAGTMPGTLETLKQNNSLLDQIQKCLEDYLESKRLLFPRFYFLSNDELLEILSQTRNPRAVQPHLSKCFDAIKSLEFSSSDSKSIDIIAMISPEGERVPFLKTVKARGNVEVWLCSVEEAMVSALKKLLKTAVMEFVDTNRAAWVKEHAAQVVITGNQIIWCRDVSECIETKDCLGMLAKLKQKWITNLSQLAGIVRGDLTKLQRGTLGALITIDVHNRDIISDMIDAKVTDYSDFEWNKQMRYYWNLETDSCQIKMSSSTFNYGYEYLGCSPRLVITPLTDRCYLTLTGAMQLNLGGSPVGPAGTGKTETVKDLAKALARQCIVYNCSDGMDYKMMGKMFAGLAQSGAWCCFDEFNRIDIEVLSVVAQQLLTIKNAKDIKAVKFIFEGRAIRLIDTCCAFITMNPGYAGRTELPDNLKALFRPISMMIPDYGLIAEIMLFSEGFGAAKLLSGKVFNLYKLCSEQLSKQDHYDFGMRAVKSVLVKAGALKRSSPELSEEMVLIRSLRDSNLPKFLSEDVGLFKGILQDLFPGLSIIEQDYGIIVNIMKEIMQEKSLEVLPEFVVRIIQLWETMKIRHGVMLVGPTGGGKTTNYEILKECLNRVYGRTSDPELQKVKTWVINPKCINLSELYGEFNIATMEWKDGLIGTIFRAQVADNSLDEKWLVCDGPVDALWIENMNTVLDDNKLLTLINGERIKMNNTMHLLFEVADLAVASPATVSRCGMVYMDPSDLGWRPCVKKWIKQLPPHVTAELKNTLWKFFDTYIDDGLRFVRKSCKEYISTVDVNLVTSVCKLLSTFVNKTNQIDFKQNSSDLSTLFGYIFVFCFTWGVGGNLADGCEDRFDSFVHDIFEVNHIAGVQIPASNTIFSYFVDLKSKTFSAWDSIVPPFKYSSEVPYFQMMVPTSDTTKFSYLLDSLLSNGYPVIFSGNTGVGKSVIAQDMLNRTSKANNYFPLNLNFSAQTKSAMTQQIIESKLEKKKKNTLGPPSGISKVVLFIDDLNMPKLDTYGSQPTIELLRQYLDFSGFYDREKLIWTEVHDLAIIATCAPPGGGRNHITSRLLSHFNLLNITAPNEMVLGKIFKTIVEGFLKPFMSEVRSVSDAIVNSSTEIYHRMCLELLPTPAKSHYTFNLRDLSKVVQGILQVKPSIIQTKNDMVRVFCHESSRIFHDRLIDETDRNYFNRLLSDLVEKNFGITVPKETLVHSPIIFGDFSKRGIPQEERVYVEMADSKVLVTQLEEYLEEYNVTMNKEVRLIFFLDAQQHITRISRILRQPRGNALLVGVGGTGKQSLTRLACHIADYPCHQIELTRAYGESEWKEDIKKMYRIAGMKGKHCVFLLSDTQIKTESFLEDINSILNSGEVPNLFELDERERILGELRQYAREKGLPEDKDSISQLFTNRVRDNLHIVFATSPVGDTFRNRCRMFPSLVNCCTIDWFDEWPRDALLSVSQRFLKYVDLGSDDMRDRVAEACVGIHENVGDIAKRYYAELKRRYYTTPTSYLELINLYISMLAEKRAELGGGRDRLRNGLNKLSETNDLVAKMQIELQLLGPELISKAKDVEELMVKIAKDQITADGVKKIVAEEEAIVRVKAIETEVIATEAQRDLDEALPALSAAFKALDALDKKDIAELKVFSKPPELVLLVLETVCILFKVKPDWDSSKKILSDPQLMKKMQEYDKDNIAESTTKKLRKYIENPNFNPESVEKVSKACKSLCMWVIAMDIYSRVFKEVAPKKKRLEEAQATLEVIKNKLAEKTAALQEVEAQLEVLKQTYENSIASKQQLSDNMDQTTQRLARASKLTTALADEQVRWAESVELLNLQIESLIGNVFLSAACVAYFGAFSAVYRKQLIAAWTQKCSILGINVSETFSLTEMLADPNVVREWNIQGLPADQLSIENGLLVTRGRRWPLMIDPQGQANRWIRNKEGTDLKVVKLSEPKYLRSLENAIRTGQSVLLEDVGEQLDPALEPLLLKQVIRAGGRLLIKLGDAVVDYDRNFKLYITTKMPNPHYLPEVCIKVTIINFTVTNVGLEGQLLADVVKLERPELEQQRSSLIINISNDKKQLKDIEEKILKMLFNSQGNILDDEELISTLNKSKITSAAIKERVALSEITEQDINVAREKYRPVALRGAILFFVLADLVEIDPMYQFSLKYFKNLFNNTILESEKSDDFQTRINTLCSNATFNVFTNVSRGLFEKHKLIFSFMICTQILKQQGFISEVEWSYFLRGGSLLRTTEIDKPTIPWLTEQMWNNVQDLSSTIIQFSFLTEHLITYADEWNFLIESDNPYNEAIPGDSTGQLSDFHRLLLVKVLREEKLMGSIVEFTKSNMGRQFIDIPPLALASAYKDTSCRSPLIFILSSGSDPIASLMKFAGQKTVNMIDRLHMISLGQGQGPIAEELMRKAAQNGDWVFLQNCHLAASWMSRLDFLVKEFSSPETEVNPNFRLFLSSMPSKVFPTAVLQDSAKVTNEPPKGLKANLARSFADVSKDLFDEQPPQGIKFKKLLFGICFFNAIIQERKKFGPLGWNICYDWSSSDLEVSISILNNMLQESKYIPWTALIYLTGDITFGGRVTDDWDRRTLSSILNKYYTKEILEDGYKFSPSGIYYAPCDGDLNSFRNYIDNLPFEEDPSIFDMNENANISFQLQETRRVIKTILDVQPRLVSTGSGNTNEEIVDMVATSILEEWPSPIIFDTAASGERTRSAGTGKKSIAEMFKKDGEGRMINSLSTVLSQEVTRYNKLLMHIKYSLENLVMAIKGIVVMSAELELVFHSLLINQVPSDWEAVAYPSLKTLASWIKDLHKRVQFLESWAIDGQPASFWISGFFFPQGFLTGVLQNHARKYNIPIDSLTFSYRMTDLEIEDDVSTIFEEDGVLVHGLYIEGARWNKDREILEDSLPMEMFSMIPMIRFIPKQKKKAVSLDEYSNSTFPYTCPLYKTTARAGTLSTTGQSTNYVVAVKLPSDKPQDYWVMKGVALLCQLSD